MIKIASEFIYNLKDFATSSFWISVLFICVSLFVIDIMSYVVIKIAYKQRKRFKSKLLVYFLNNSLIALLTQRALVAIELISLLLLKKENKDIEEQETELEDSITIYNFNHLNFNDKFNKFINIFVGRIYFRFR